jgi:hypothetical protein
MRMRSLFMQIIPLFETCHDRDCESGLFLFEFRPRLCSAAPSDSFIELPHHVIEDTHPFVLCPIKRLSIPQSRQLSNSYTFTFSYQQTNTRIKMVLTGHCLCKAVTYTIDVDQPLLTGYDHCDDCQRQSGSTYCKRLSIAIPRLIQLHLSPIVMIVSLLWHSSGCSSSKGQSRYQGTDQELGWQG